MLALEIHTEIAKRMRDLGHGDSYSTKREKVINGGISQSRNAYNEYWYLVQPSLAAGGDLKIISTAGENLDTIIAADYNALEYTKLHEFSGFIQITQNPSVKLEFIRVIPELKKEPGERI